MISASFNNAPGVAAAIRARGERILVNLSTTMTRLMVMLERKIVTDKLQGQVLHHRTGKLGGSVHHVPTHAEGTTLIAQVEAAGGPAFYGRIHEYGGVFEVSQHARRLGSRSRILKTLRESRRYGIDEVTHGTVRAHQVVFPERSFMRTSLAEMRQQFIDEIRQSVANSVRS